MDCNTCKSTHNDKGEEIPDQTPIEIPLGYHHPPSISDIIRDMIQSNELKNNKEVDSEEEANDFGEEDDISPSGHEYTQMHEDHLLKERKNIDELAKLVQSEDEKLRSNPAQPAAVPTPAPAT